MKKIINRSESVLAEMCSGMAVAHPELKYLARYKVIKKKEINRKKVTLISGGGCGHEPAHAGFVGKGMLDAAVCGDVFASPSQIQVYQAIRETASDKGTLLIIKNYSGDMMNFQNAAYMAREDKIAVDFVRVDDDIAVRDSLYTVGRRGVAGTVLVHKIAGAAAEAGMSLPEVKAAAEKVIANVRSIGFALTSCTVPAKGSATFAIAEDEMEYGVGIHGEPGIQRESVKTADVMARKMVSSLLEDLGAREGDALAVMVNGLGGSPLQELYLMNNSVCRELDRRKMKIKKIFVGNYMTSLDMAGASISLLKLDTQLEELLFAPCAAPAFHMDGSSEEVRYVDAAASGEEAQDASGTAGCYEEYGVVKGEVVTLENMIFLVNRMSDCVIQNEVPFCELDTHAGDGDFGMSVARGFRQLKRDWKSILKCHGGDIGDFLMECSMVIMEYCGGATGPIWGSAFRAAGRCTKGKQQLAAEEFAQMLQAAVQGIQATGKRAFGRGAVVGDKTLVDALAPCADVWMVHASKRDTLSECFEKGAAAAADGAKATKAIAARMGRAGTVGERSIGYPDAGAYALGVIFTELSRSLSWESDVAE